MEEIITVLINGMSFAAKLTKAAKPHICRGCGKKIEKGEYYYRYFFSAKACLCTKCAKLYEAPEELCNITKQLIKL